MTRTNWANLEELAALLRAAVGADSYGRWGEYRIDLNGDVFVLVGSVPDTRLRSRAEKRLRTFARIDKIKNDLVLEAPARRRPDDEIFLAHHAGFPQTVDAAEPPRRLRHKVVTSRKSYPGRVPAKRADLTADPKEVTRPARIMVEGNVRRGAIIVVRVDLPSEPIEPGERVVSLGTFPPGWEELRILVRLAGSMLEDVEDLDPEVVLLENGSSRPASFRGRVKSDAEGELELDAVFFHGARFCGIATSRVPVSMAIAAAGPTPRTTLDARSALTVIPAAAGPLLTVAIIAEGATQSWFWTTPHPLENGDAYDRADGAGAADFARSTFAGCPKFGPADFRQRMESVGERVWDATPAKFRAAYLELRARFGATFPIQLVTRDAWMPWEVMKPHGQGIEADHLFLTHPISRWPVENANRMSSTVPPGVAVTFAPDYPGKEALPAAQDEKALVKALFGAEEGVPTRAAFLDLLEDRQERATSIVHFAGHATSDAGERQGGLVMTADTVTLDDVDRDRVRLGRNSHSLVILNACEAGQQREQLGMVAGWATALARRHFGGVIAPLWKVQDAVAGRLMAETLGALSEGCPIGEALRRGRAATCEASVASFAYIAHGDVMMTLERQPRKSV